MDWIGLYLIGAVGLFGFFLGIEVPRGREWAYAAVCSVFWPLTLAYWAHLSWGRIK